MTWTRMDRFHRKRHYISKWYQLILRRKINGINRSWSCFIFHISYFGYWGTLLCEFEEIRHLERLLHFLGISSPSLFRKSPPILTNTSDSSVSSRLHVRNHWKPFRIEYVTLFRAALQTIVGLGGNPQGMESASFSNIVNGLKEEKRVEFQITVHLLGDRERRC